VEIYRANSDVRVTPFSPLGGRVVEIKRGTYSEDMGPNGGAYRGFTSDPEGENAEVIDGKAEGELLQTLNALIEENRKGVKKIVDNLATVSERLTQAEAGVLGYLINSEEGSERLDRITASMANAAERVDTIVERVERGEGVVGGLLKEDTPLDRDIKGAAAGIRETSEHLSDILARANDGESALGVLVADASHGGVSDEMGGIVKDIKVVTGEVADGNGTLGKLVHDDRLYEGAAGTAENLDSITAKIDSGQGLLGVLLEEESGQNARDTLSHMASITAAVDDPEAGTLGMLVHDDTLRGRIGRIAEEIERLVVEFRDSAEDLREQAPVNAFIGAVFSAF
jgi:phospholipid/cholesterol/gamma-HCH transport system substrate-binding protein